jgi:hypothetical protein
MFKKEDTAKSELASEIFIEVPKSEPVKEQTAVQSGLSSDSIVAEISRLPNQSAVFESCDINTWNEVYIALGKLKLHTRAKWDEPSKVLRYR